MELSWLMRMRIAAAAAVGVIIIGILAWPLAEPPEPFDAVFVGTINFAGAITLAILAFLTGLIGYFLSWPFGREIGVLAVPVGLGIWSLRSGNVADLIRLNPSLPQRQALFATLKWESIFWLAIVAIGFLGVLMAQKICPAQTKSIENEQDAKPKSNMYLSAAIAMVGSLLIAQFCIKIFAQEVRVYDGKLGSVIAQPAVGQIAFAVVVSFGIAAFLVKKFLNVNYIWTAIASAFVTMLAANTYLKQEILQHFLERHPVVFFSEAVSAILPLQMVAFGVLGSIWGYWMAVRYDHWRKHEFV